MSQDRSLDEFADRTDTGDADGDDASERHGPPDADIEVIFAWSQAGGECAACGEEVERRWRSDHGLVCESCKIW